VFAATLNSTLPVPLPLGVTRVIQPAEVVADQGQLGELAVMLKYGEGSTLLPGEVVPPAARAGTETSDGAMVKVHPVTWQ
jgi:hypothetical protein